MQILTWLSTQLDLGQILRFNVHFGIVCREGWFNFVYQWAIYTVLLTLCPKLLLLLSPYFCCFGNSLAPLF